MRLLLLADREPYGSFGCGAEESGGFSLEIARPESFAPSPGFDLVVIPADCYLGLSIDTRPLPTFAYGPAALMSASFREGCLDYLREPWDLGELFARAARFQSLRVCGQGFALQLSGTRLYVTSPRNRELSLNESERRLLRILMLNAGQPVPRRALAFALWGEERAASRAPDVHISAMRKKLEILLPGVGDLIKASRGHGYRLLMQPCA